MALRRGALSSLFAPAYVPGNSISEQDIANWQSGRVGMWPQSQVNQYQVPMPRTGTTSGNPTSATTVDPALLQAWSQNQPYTPGPNVTVVPPGLGPTGGGSGGGSGGGGQPTDSGGSISRDELAALLMQRQGDVSQGVSAGDGAGGGG